MSTRKNTRKPSSHGAPPRRHYVLVKELRDGGLSITTSGTRAEAAQLLLLGVLAHVTKRGRRKS